MKILGLPIPFTRRKALNSVDNHGTWLSIVREPFGGAWQRNIEIDRAAAMAYHADFACKTLIARDIAKLRIKLVENQDAIWTETTNSAYTPVLRKPNHFQTRNQFWESWILSKLNRGNAYVLKKRDARNVVSALYVLDPTRVTPLVADDGAVFYRLSADDLAGVEGDILVPAREMIHDRMNCLFHPLVGIPPIFASGLAAMQGLNIQTNSARLFENNSMPGGILSSPGNVSAKEAEEWTAEWEKKFGGKNRGRIAILGGGLKFEKLALTAVEGQMIEQLKWSGEVVCSTYHVPPYKIGIGSFPPYTNVQSANIEYYSQALQSLIEEAEECLDEGLGIGWAAGIGTEFDIENLLRMDSVTQMDVIDKAAGKLSPNEQRAKLGYKPVPGGGSPMVQQQNFSLEALAKRDAGPDPFGSKPPSPPPEPKIVEPPDASKMLNPARVKSIFAISKAA